MQKYLLARWVHSHPFGAMGLLVCVTIVRGYVVLCHLSFLRFYSGGISQMVQRIGESMQQSNCGSGLLLSSFWGAGI